MNYFRTALCLVLSLAISEAIGQGYDDKVSVNINSTLILPFDTSGRVLQSRPLSAIITLTSKKLKAKLGMKISSGLSLAKGGGETDESLLRLSYFVKNDAIEFKYGQLYSDRNGYKLTAKIPILTSGENKFSLFGSMAGSEFVLPVTESSDKQNENAMTRSFENIDNARYFSTGISVKRKIDEDFKLSAKFGFASRIQFDNTRETNNTWALGMEYKKAYVGFEYTNDVPVPQFPALWVGVFKIGF